MRDIDKAFSRDKFPDYISDAVLTAAKHLHSGLYFKDIGDDAGSFNDTFLSSIIASGSEEAQENKETQLIFRIKGFIYCLKNSGEYSWKKAAEIYEDNADQGKIWLAAAIYHSFYWSGISGKKPITNGEFDKWREKLLDVLLEAEDSIFNMPTNAYSWAYFFENEIISEINKDKELYPQGLPKKIMKKKDINLNAPWAGHIIQIMIKTLNATENDSLFFRKHINREQSSRDYFIRSLTCAFLQETGAPYRRVVAEISSTIFDCDLSEREVIRISKGVDPSNHFEVVNSLTRKLLNRICLYSDPLYDNDDNF